MIVQGTTSKQIFPLPFPLVSVRNAYVTITQNGSVVLDLGSERLSAPEDSQYAELELTLTQEETFMLDYGKLAVCEITVDLVDGGIYKSNKVPQRVIKSERRKVME